MLTQTEILKLINYLKEDNKSMQADIDSKGDIMPTMKALFESAIADNQTLIKKLEQL